ncbi:MAG: hypothetical protein ACTS5F_01855, partial [Candidatus Hodgkinia cicadicola]
SIVIHESCCFRLSNSFATEANRSWFAILNGKIELSCKRKFIVNVSFRKVESSGKRFQTWD